VDEIIRLAGGVNVFGDLGSLYAAVSPEELVARDIDVVLLQKESTFDRRLVDGARIVEVGGALELPGPAVAEAAREVARALRGGP
jgi:ABC-type Fe3+-hydroxamate transport system substrate-binding protein